MLLDTRANNENGVYIDGTYYYDLLPKIVLGPFCCQNSPECSFLNQLLFYGILT